MYRAKRAGGSRHELVAEDITTAVADSLGNAVSPSLLDPSRDKTRAARRAAAIISKNLDT